MGKSEREITLACPRCYIESSFSYVRLGRSCMTNDEIYSCGSCGFEVSLSYIRSVKKEEEKRDDIPD